jgi:translation initiation factor IF-2
LKGTVKIRINELARELEVKAGAVIDSLPGFGVEEPKTHSSSIDEEVAEKVRDLFRRAPGGEDAALTSANSEPPSATEPAAPVVQAAAEKISPPPPPRKKEIPNLRPSIPVGRGAMPLRPPVHALRPPLRRPAPSAAPVTPPALPVAAASPALPVAAAPPVPPAPPLTAVSALAPELAVPSPALAAPVPKIPSISSSQPAAAPGRPVKPIPTQRSAPGVAQGPRSPLAPASPAAATPAAATPAAPVARRPMPPQPAGSGVPSRRPLVPPGGTVPKAAPAAARARQTPRKPIVVPGKPIYQRPKPSGPMPGMPAPRPTARPGMPRPMHPVGRPGFSPGPPGARPPFNQHRPRPRARTARDREAEREEKLLRRQNRTTAQAAVAVNKEVTVSAGTTVKELAEKLGIKANLIIKALVDRGLFATINQTLDLEMIEELCKQFGATTTETTFEEEVMQEVRQAEEAGDLLPRAPVVTVMGHVDHGKTSLLDAVREANVAEREAGGITQAIGAYHVEKNGRRIVFVDTPGHEAFTRMRARGARITDIVILVVAADDGVMPQTLEAMDHAKAAGVPIIVAVNKIDKEGADPDRVKQQLADRGLLPEDWGGDTVMVSVSAHTKENLDLLLEMVLLVADLKELTANPERPGVGTVLECKLDRGQGPVATVVIQNGSIRVGDHFLVGSVFGRVRALLDDRGAKVKVAGPSSAVVVLGLEGIPEPGDSLQVVSDTDKAKKIAEYREDKLREQSMAKTARLSLDQLQEQLRQGEIKELPVVLKADVQGSVEVLTDSLAKLSTEQVKIRMIHSGVGAISESDVLLATAANAVIIGFSVRPERSAAALADREKIDVRLHTVIYELIDEMKKAMAGLLDPIIKETFHGRADVREVFHITKVGAIAGCIMQDGRGTRKSQVRLLRDNVVVYTGKVSSLRRFKDEAAEVRSGQECGIGLENFGDIKQGDVIELFETEKVAQEVLV